MQFGVTVPNIHETLADARTISAVAQRAERLGFDSLWVNDHVVIPSEPSPGAAERTPAFAASYGEQRGQLLFEPLITLAYLCGITERIRLGTSVYLLPLRHPVLAAKQVVSLDVLSRGRAILGVGVGWLEAEFAAVGVPFRQRGARTDEALRTLKELCRDAGFLPKPVQRPHPPLWIGGRSEAALRRAARLGDAWHPSHLTCEELRRRIPELQRECEGAGRAPADVAVTSRRRLVRGDGTTEAEPDRILHGSPSRIAATIAELEEVGVSHLIVEVPGTEEPELLENLEWFGREVLSRDG